MDKDELEYLETVGRALDEQIKKHESHSEKNKNEMIETKKFLIDEAKVVRGFDDFINLSVANQIMNESEDKYVFGRQALNNLLKMKGSPYFGRMDFLERGADSEEKIYIGMNSLYDEKNFTFYVYDWRAPISSMFYDYGTGEARYETPGGEISGEVLNKRQYKIADGKMLYMFDSDIVIDDDILKYELSKPSAAAAKPVINSIQQAQNKAIRFDRKENLVVFGVAGSGKTVVGLHRLSYMLYKYRGSLTSGDIRIFSNNGVFISYISNIMPELGEENVPALDFKDLMISASPYKMKFKDIYEQMEYLSDESAGNSTRARGIRLKYSDAFLDFTAGFIKKFNVKFNDVTFYGHTVCAGSDLDEKYRDRTRQSDLRLKTERVSDYLGQKFDEFFEANKKTVINAFNERSSEYLNEKDCAQLFNNFKNKTLVEISKRANPGAAALYDKTLKAYCADDPGVYKYTANYLGNLERAGKSFAGLNYEDALVIFYIETLKGGVKKNNSVKHILIDEAQDLNKLQHRLIRMIFTECRFTVLADINQALHPALGSADRNEIAKIYADGDNMPAVIELTKSYRQTFEIGRFASRVLNIFDEENYFKRHGDEPEIIKTDDVCKSTAELIKTINAKGYKSVGVLTARKREAESLHKRLLALTESALIVSPDAPFVSGVVVMPAAYAKGLEFDAVIITEYDRLSGGGNERMLYLMCTRALHLLYLLAAERNCK